VVYISRRVLGPLGQMVQLDVKIFAKFGGPTGPIKQRGILSKRLLQLVNRCENFPKYNMTSVMLYMTYKKLFVVKLKFKFL
jgi:hypothetical protein